MLYANAIIYHTKVVPSYLPLDLSSQHLLLDAVQRSRLLRKKKNTEKVKQFPKLTKYVQENEFNKEGKVIFSEIGELESYLKEKSLHMKNKHSQIENCSLDCSYNSNNHNMR